MNAPSFNLNDWDRESAHRAEAARQADVERRVAIRDRIQSVQKDPSLLYKIIMGEAS